MTDDVSRCFRGVSAWLKYVLGDCLGILCVIKRACSHRTYYLYRLPTFLYTCSTVDVSTVKCLYRKLIVALHPVQRTEEDQVSGKSMLIRPNETVRHIISITQAHPRAINYSIAFQRIDAFALSHLNHQTRKAASAITSWFKSSNRNQSEVEFVFRDLNSSLHH